MGACVQSPQGKVGFQSAKILRDKFVLERDDGLKVYLAFFNADDPTKNVFQVTHQTTIVGKYKNRYDVTILKNFAISFLARDHIVKMLSRYMVLNDTDRVLLVMRPYQIYAVEALVRQATLPTKNAYIWHTTGAGKTLTSFKTAQILAARPEIKKVIYCLHIRRRR